MLDDALFAIDLPDLAATETFAARLAAVLRPGDVVALEGPLGAGKSALARAAIRRLAGAEIEVPSPTFNIVQTYETAGGEVWHVDLYRLGNPAELDELGLDEAFEHAICLVEWPGLLGSMLPRDALTIRLEAGETGESRRAILNGSGDWRARLGDFDPAA